MTDRYLEIIREEMADIKAKAIAARTYGDWWELENDIREAREYLRSSLRKHRREAASYRAKSDKFEAKWGSRLDLCDDFAARREAVAQVEAALRDEYTAGLREMAAQDREERRWLKQYRAQQEAAS